VALSDGDKHKIVRLLGWPGTVLISTSLDYNNIVVGRLTGLNAAIEADARSLIDRIKRLDERRDEALDRAAVEKIDDIEMNPEELNLLARERRKLQRELSDLMAIPLIASGGINVHVTV
jgi:hypothetical protein